MPRSAAILAGPVDGCLRSAAFTAKAAASTIDDCGGLPPALRASRYPAPRAPPPRWRSAHAYPLADAPVVQLAFDASQPAPFHDALGRKLDALRGVVVTIVGSGDLVHNLRMVNWGPDAQLPPIARMCGPPNSRLWRFCNHVSKSVRPKIKDLTLRGMTSY